VDAEPGGSLQLGLVEVTDAAFGHQPGRFMGESPPALARAGLGVLAGAMHGETSGETWAECSASA
jgi:hypothetical protein